jgi:GNAT superfamily N-acetyltransferase
VVCYYLSPATHKDFVSVYELKKIAYKEYIEQIWGWDDEFQIKFQKENFALGNTNLIKAESTTIGSVDIKEGDKSIFISGLYLLPEYQSKGIGTTIIQGLIKKAKTEKKRLELEVLRVNIKAIRFYQRLGFVLEERDKEKYFMYR